MTFVALPLALLEPPPQLPEAIDEGGGLHPPVFIHGQELVAQVDPVQAIGDRGDCRGRQRPTQPFAEPPLDLPRTGLVVTCDEVIADFDDLSA